MRQGLRRSDEISLINTIQSIVGVDIDRFVPYPIVDGKSTNGGYCGPAVKPIALNMVKNCAQHPEVNLPISGIGGVENWRDAVEFILLGATTVQVCTAVMHFGFGIVEDMIDGLSNFLDEKGMKSVAELRGAAVPAYKEWGELDLSYKLVAKINEDIHDAAALPGRIQLCGRSWRKDELARTFTAARIREEFGVEPMIVDPGPFASCPPGPCTDVAQAEACHVVIWVRVGQDGYMDYSLQGGP